MDGVHGLIGVVVIVVVLLGGGVVMGSQGGIDCHGRWDCIGVAGKTKKKVTDQSGVWNL